VASNAVNVAPSSVHSGGLETLANWFVCSSPTIKIGMNEQQPFEWGELGEKWWRESGASCRATETQIKYACSRHQGANKSKAATLAGYSGDAEALRSAGVRAEGTKAVDDLLTLAAAAGDGGSKDGPATAKEIDLKLTKLVRSPDGALSLKAIEVMERRERERRQRGEAPENDGLSTWRFERDLLGLPNGGTAYLLLAGGVHNLRLLHDTHHVVMNEEFGPEIWARFYERLSDGMREHVDQALADPGWQLDVRHEIWGEIGQKPPGPVLTKTDRLRRPDEPVRWNGSRAPEPAGDEAFDGA
jgi:hypothetical protein